MALQPAGRASAQGTTVGGQGFNLISCASNNPDLICSPVNGTVANPGSRDVAFIFNLGTDPNQLYTLVRVTLGGGSADAVIPVVPTPIGTAGLVRDTVPAAGGQVACYQLIAASNGTAFRSDFECVIFGLAQGLIPAEAGFALNQTNNLTVTWQPVAGATSYLLYTLGTDGVAVTTSTSGTLQGNGGLICAIVIPLNAQGTAIGASNAGCGFPNNSSGTTSPTLTPTRTSTPGGSSTPTRTPTATSTPTTAGTLVPTSTSTPTSTTGPTNTVTRTPTATSTTSTLPDLTVSVESHPTAASPGGVITYRLIVANQGSTAASGITVQNNLPAGVVLLSSSGTNGFECGTPVSSGVMACTGGSVNGGAAATIDIVGFIDAPCVNPSPFVDAATVNPNQTIPESNYGNNDGFAPTVVSGCPVLTVTPTAPAVTLTPTGTPTAMASLTPTATRTLTAVASLTPTVTGTPSVDLAVSVFDSGSDPVQSPGSPGNGGLISYILAVSNVGASQATGVTVTDTLENGFVFACGGAGVAPGDQCNTSDPSASNAVTFVNAQGTGGFNCAPSTSGSPAVTSVVCSGGTVAANGGTTINISVSTTASCAFILNRAVVDSSGTIAESNETNNVGYAQTACGAGASTPTPLATLTPTRTPGP